MNSNERIIVVGGGISGLTTATSLVKRGVNVLLIEKNDSCGGLVNSFTHEGFLFDAGVRAIENAGMIKPMLKELDIDLTLFPSKVSLGLEDEVINVETEDSVDDYEQLLKRFYPESRDDVEKVIGVIKKFDEYMKVLFGSDSPFFKDAKRERKYFFTTFISWIFRFLATGMAVMRMRMPVENFLHKLMNDESLIDIISQHFFIGTPAFFAMSYFSLYTDYFYPKGGVGQIPHKLEETFVTLGGKLEKNANITAVDVKKRQIIDQNNREYSYDRLIWCADLKYLYRIVKTDGLPSNLSEKIMSEKRNILSKKGAESVFTLFLGIDQDPEVYRKISYGHFFYTPSRKGLGSLQREDLKKMLASWDTITKDDVFEWLRKFCRLNTYEISLPVLNDPQAAPPGKTGIIASFLMDYELTKRITDDGWYDEFEEYIEDTMLSVLNDSIYPDLKEHLLFKFSASPLSIEKRSGSSEGAIVGWSFEEPIPIDSGILNMKDSVRTSIPNLYKAGQWAASPAGIPTCILTAKLAADLVFKELS